MNLTRSSQRVTAFFLLVILGGNFVLSVFWYQWRLSLFWHDHIIIGPLYPGWEDHHGYRHPHNKSELPTDDAQFSFYDSNNGVSTKIISVFQSLVGTILCFGGQLLWLTEWPIVPEFSSIVWWPFGLVSLILSSAFLPPPDKPPSASLQ